MRKSKAELTQEIFWRSEKKIEERKNHYAIGGVCSIFACLALILGAAICYNPPKVFGDKAVRVIAFDKEESRSYYANEVELVETLLERLGGYVEIIIPDKTQYTEENASHYFVFEDINGMERVYYLYEDGTLITSGGLSYRLSEEEREELVGDVSKTFCWSQEDAILQYQLLLQNLAKKYSDSINGHSLYGDVFGGAYINDYGELVVLLVEITPESIKEIQEAVCCKNIIVKKCEYSYSELITVRETLINEMKLDDENLFCIASVWEEVKENRVRILVRKLTSEKETAIRTVIDSPCMEIEDSGSEVVESPLEEREINQLPGANMQVVKDSVTPTGCSVQFSYTGEGEIMYGPSMYIIEKYNEEMAKWYRITCYRVVATLEAQIFSAERTVTEVYDWEYDYDILSEGRYRLLADCSYWNGSGDKEDIWLAAEFCLN